MRIYCECTRTIRMVDEATMHQPRLHMTISLRSQSLHPLVFDRHLSGAERPNQVESADRHVDLLGPTSDTQIDDCNHDV